eukprot:3076187-Rhodomonas_salina.1
MAAAAACTNNNPLYTNRHPNADIFKNFIANGTLFSKLKDLSYEDFLKRVADQDVLTSTLSAADHVFYMAYSTRRAWDEVDKVPESNLDARVFVASYTFCLYPEKVMDSLCGYVEEPLISSSKKLVTAMERVCAAFEERDYSQSAVVKIAAELQEFRMFPEILFEYVDRFKSWKIAHEDRMLQRLELRMEAMRGVEEEFERAGVCDKGGVIDHRKKMIRFKILEIAGLDYLNEMDARFGMKGVEIQLERPMTRKEWEMKVEQEEAREAEEEGRGGLALPDSNRGSSSWVPNGVSNADIVHGIVIENGYKFEDDGSSLAECEASFRYRTTTIYEDRATW